MKLIKIQLFFLLTMSLKIWPAKCHSHCFNIDDGGLDRWHNRLRFLTHWGRVTHLCVDKLTIIGSDNGLSPERRQAIIWTNAGILIIGPLGTNFSEILSEIHTFSLQKIRLKSRLRNVVHFVSASMCFNKSDYIDITPCLMSDNRVYTWSDYITDMYYCVFPGKLTAWNT